MNGLNYQKKLKTHWSYYKNMKQEEKLLLFLSESEIQHSLFLNHKNEYLFYQELTKHYKIILLCFTSNQRNLKKIELSKNLFQISVPSLEENKSKISNKNSNKRNKGIYEECIKNEYFISLFNSLVKMSCVIIYSNPYFFPLLKIKGLKPSIFIYKNIGLHFIDSKSNKSDLFLNAAIATSNATIADSEDAKRYFLDMNKNIYPDNIFILEKNNDLFNEERISINEKDILKKIFFYNSRQLKNRIVFIGLNKQVYFDAGAYIITNLSKELPNIEFVIIGPVCEYIKENHIIDIGENIILIDELDEIKTNIILSTCNLAIHPVIEETNTNSTIIDYISNKLPIITTQIGIKYLNMKNKTHCIISEINSFSKNIIDLLKDVKLYKNLSSNSYNYYKNNFNLQSQVKKFNKILEKFI